MTAAVTISQLSKTYGPVHALADISLTIEPGERVALIGASGSGKSTLIRHIAGLTAGDAGSGRVEVFGETIQANGHLSGRARILRRHVGMIFQQFNLVSRMSVISNVLVGLLGHIPSWRGTLGLFTASEKRRAMEALDTVGIADFAAQRAARLSGGQQQRVAIARSLIQEARIILADEPIASLDPKSAKRVMEILIGLNKRLGITLVTSLHQVDYAMAFFDRLVALKDGKVVYDGATKDVSVTFLTSLYGAQAEELILPGQLGISEDDDATEVRGVPQTSAPNGQNYAAGGLTAGV
ncbi:MAG: phosphonate ABC transporter ATP-binding protein [Pseudomonadota bacterium]